MSRELAEDFLSGVHVGVLSLAHFDSGPHATPIWYRYSPGGNVEFTTSDTSRKLALIQEMGRATLCVQQESWPSRYVSVEGPIRVVGPRTDEVVRRIAVRYLGETEVHKFAAKIEGQGVVVHLTPDRWMSEDFA